MIADIIAEIISNPFNAILASFMALLIIGPILLIIATIIEVIERKRCISDKYPEGKEEK